MPLQAMLITPISLTLPCSRRRINRELSVPSPPFSSGSWTFTYEPSIFFPSMDLSTLRLDWYGCEEGVEVRELLHGPQNLDVCLVFPREGRQLWASSKTLAEISPYWKTQLSSSGFCEDIDDKGEPIEMADLFDDSDNELDNNPSSSPRTLADSPPFPSGTRTIPITGTLYKTYRAFLCWLYTGQLKFAPLTSTFLRTSSSQVNLPNSPSSPGPSPPSSLLSARRARHSALASLPVLAAPPALSLPVVSPKSLYRLAHFLEIPALQSLCLSALRDNLTVDSVPREMLGVFAAVYEEVWDAEVKLSSTPPGTRTIPITGTMYKTYRAFVCWLYTSQLKFAPLTSTFLRTPSSEADLPSSSSGPAPTATSSLLSARRARRAALSPLELIYPSSPPAVSPKSLYRLAHFLQIPALQSLCVSALLEKLTVDTVPQEMLGNFAEVYPEVWDAELQWTRERWKKVKGGEGMRAAAERMKREGPTEHEMATLLTLFGIEGE
ncbi:hypothetical protein JCM1840_001775 [Sporobolomyces johnsonii]